MSNVSSSLCPLVGRLSEYFLCPDIFLPNRLPWSRTFSYYLCSYWSVRNNKVMSLTDARNNRKSMYFYLKKVILVLSMIFSRHGYGAFFAFPNPFYIRLRISPIPFSKKRVIDKYAIHMEYILSKRIDYISSYFLVPFKLSYVTKKGISQKVERIVLKGSIS